MTQYPCSQEKEAMLPAEGAKSLRRQNQGLGSFLGRFQNETESSSHKTSTQKKETEESSRTTLGYETGGQGRVKTEMEDRLSGRAVTGSWKKTIKR